MGIHRETGLKRINTGNLGNGNGATKWISYLMGNKHSQADPDIAEIFMLWDSVASGAQRIDEHKLIPSFITTAVSCN